MDALSFCESSESSIGRIQALLEGLFGMPPMSAIH